MAVTGLGSSYGNVYESRYASSKKEVTEKQEAGQASGKKPRKKFAPQNHYEKRKYLREQFEERQARKALIRGQLGGGQEEKEIHESLQGKSAFTGKRNAFRAIARYEASILKS